MKDKKLPDEQNFVKEPTAKEIKTLEKKAIDEFNKHVNTSPQEILKDTINNMALQNPRAGGVEKRNPISAEYSVPTIDAELLMDTEMVKAAKAFGVEVETAAEAAQYVETAKATNFNLATAKAIADNYVSNMIKKIVFQHSISRNWNVTDLFNLFSGFREQELTSGYAIEYVYHGTFGVMLPNHPQYNKNVPDGQDFKTDVWANYLEYNPADDFKVPVMHRAFETFVYYLNKGEMKNLVDSWIRDVRQVPLLMLYNRFIDQTRALVVGASTTDNTKLLKKVGVSSTFADAMTDLQITTKSITDRTITDEININRSGKKFKTGHKMKKFVWIMTRTTATRFIASKGQIFNVKYTPGGEMQSAQVNDTNLLDIPKIIVVDSEFFDPITNTNIIKNIVQDNQVLCISTEHSYKWTFALNKETQQYFALSDHNLMVIHMWPVQGYLQNGQAFLYENNGLLIN